MQCKHCKLLLYSTVMVKGNARHREWRVIPSYLYLFWETHTQNILTYRFYHCSITQMTPKTKESSCEQIFDSMHPLAWWMWNVGDKLKEDQWTAEIVLVKCIYHLSQFSGCARVPDCLQLMVTGEEVDCSLSNQSHSQLGDTPPPSSLQRESHQKIFSVKLCWRAVRFKKVFNFLQSARLDFQPIFCLGCWNTWILQFCDTLLLFFQPFKDLGNEECKGPRMIYSRDQMHSFLPGYHSI